MAIRTLATGKPVYRMSSHAPTRGQVDPQGYLQRELRKRGIGSPNKGNDWESDRRSGLAKNLLQQRFGKAGGKTPYQNKGKPVTGKKPPPGKTGVRTDEGLTVEAKTQIAGNSVDPDNIPNQEHPVVTIGADGRLELPYDRKYGSEMLSMMDEMNAQLLELQQSEQQEGVEYSGNLRDASNSYLQQQRDTLNSDSAGGMAFSSQYGNNVGKNSGAYNNYMQELQAGHGTFQSGAAGQRSQIEIAFNDALRRLAVEQGSDMMDSSTPYGSKGETARPGSPKNLKRKKRRGKRK